MTDTKESLRKEYTLGVVSDIPMRPEQIIARFPPLGAGQTIICPVCEGLHPVRASRDHTRDGLPMELTYRCGGRTRLAGLFGRNLLARAKLQKLRPDAEGGEAMGGLAKIAFTDEDKRLSVRRCLTGESTPIREASRRRIHPRTIEEWCADPRIRGDLQITAKSTWRPRQNYSFEQKRRIVERVKAGEEPVNIAREFLGLHPSTIRNWCAGMDMRPDSDALILGSPALPKAEEFLARIEARGVRCWIEDGVLQVRPLHLLSQEESDALPRLRWDLITLVKARTPEPEVVEVKAEPAPEPAPTKAPEPAPVAAAGRHPKRDEAVAAFKGGMAPADIITVLELEVSAETVRAWALEDFGLKSNRGLVDARFTQDQKLAAVKRWANGETANDLAKELSLPRANYIYRWADHFGVEREAGIAGRVPPNKTPDSVRVRAVALLEKGMSQVLVARKVNTTQTNVSRWALQEAGKRRRAALEAKSNGAADAPAPAPAPAPVPAPAPQPAPQPAPVIAPALVVPATAKLVLVTLYRCPHCMGEVRLPEAVAGVLRIVRGQCPHCSQEVEL